MIQKIDLFVYSKFSNSPPFQIKSHLTPKQIYTHAKKIGMNLVTITDLNTIHGCLEFLNHHPDPPDFIIGEEVLCSVPAFKTEISLGVYGITESQHHEIARRRHNVDDLIPFLKEKNIPHVAGHFFDGLPASANPDYIATLLRFFDIFEVHHGKVIDEHNRMSAYFIKNLIHKGICGGSHAITKSSIGKTYTVCTGKNRSEFLINLQKGLASTEGQHGSIKTQFLEFQQHYLETLKQLSRHRHPLLLSLSALKFPYASLKNIISNMLTLRQGKKQTPLYSSLLGASLKLVCEVPKELTEN